MALNPVIGPGCGSDQAVYSSPTWTLECTGENLAQEVAPFGIRVTELEPGQARTAILPRKVAAPEKTLCPDA